MAFPHFAVMPDSQRKPTGYHRTSRAVSAAVGHATVLAVVIGATAVWMGIGLWTSFPTQWLLVTNLAGTISIFLILLAIRHSQQIHMRSIHAKLDELIRTSKGGNHMIGSEHLADDMLEELRAKHREVANRGDD